MAPSRPSPSTIWPPSFELANRGEIKDDITAEDFRVIAKLREGDER
jgi:hypothetical protein